MNKEAVDTAVSAGAVAADSMADLTSKLSAPRAVWVMVPSGSLTEGVVTRLADDQELTDIKPRVADSGEGAVFTVWLPTTDNG